ncbi:lysozyme inhibitor LprI family protein [Anderseniella sp. Alg231-50]|uniref:lysozyme inhibitor LprI family protein n=1 Tax=Anderseniella sp. Alg231-50 TaxID=1922226 RepID=UPI000D55576E
MRCLSSLFLSLLIVASSPAQAFDCAKASTETEKLICSDDGLKQADDDLGRAWRKARGLVGEAEFKLLRQNQRAWLKTRDARCGYGSDAERIACLAQQTTQRTLIIAAKAKTGPGSDAAMVPFARAQAGSKTAYEVEIAGVRFATPAEAGKASFNKVVDDLVSQAPFTEKIDFETAGQLSYNQSITLEYAAPNLVSALVQTWRYDGGAHGNYVFSSINVSPDTGELTYDRLFSPDAKAKLADVCENRLYGHDTDKAVGKAQLKEMFFPEHEKTVLTAIGNLSAWTFRADGARVHFSPYELAPYAAGSFECRLPLAVLRKLSKAAQHLPQ